MRYSTSSIDKQIQKHRKRNGKQVKKRCKENLQIEFYYWNL